MLLLIAQAQSFPGNLGLGGRPLSSLVPSPPFPGRSWDSLSSPVVVLGTPAHGMCWLHLPWDTAWPSPTKPEQGFLGTQALDS